MAVKITNPGLEVMSLPFPLQGVLGPRQSVIIGITMADLNTLCPTAITKLQVADLGNSYAGPNDNARYGIFAFYYKQASVMFGLANVAAGDNATVASSTPVAVAVGGASGLAGCSFVAPRAGSITALAASLSVAAAGSAAIVGVYKNGTLLCSITLAVSATEGSAAYDPGTYTFDANDNITVAVRTGSGWTATTSDLAAFVEARYDLM